MLEPIDFQLLYLVADAEKQNIAVSTWYLAKIMASSPSNIKNLDNILRHHLNLLVKKGLLKRTKYRKDTKDIYYCYSTTSTKTLCLKGSLFILDKPITIIACPHVETCTSNCKLYPKKTGDTITFQGCQLLNELEDQQLKQKIYTLLTNERPKKL